jgi:DNA repair exonuclease SbcCD nuclease subunit
LKMTETVGKFKFLQFSDVLLDSKLTHAGMTNTNLTHNNFALPREERTERAREILEATINAFSLAKRENVDAIIIPGGLWDNVTVTGFTVNTLIEAVASLGDIPVYIAPGHRDFYTRSCLYTNDMLSARGYRHWPANVHIFTSEHFAAVAHPHRDDVAFVGRAFSKASRRTERILSGKLPKLATAKINIGVFAGTLETHPSVIADASRQQVQKPLVYPFSETELANQGLTYAAVGNIKEAYQITTADEKLLGAYAGCLAGGTFDELGPRYAILGEIEIDSSGNSVVNLVPQELDVRRMMLVTVDVSGLGDEDIQDEILVNIEESGVRADCDIIAINLEGRHKPGANPKQVADQMASDFYHLLVVDNTRADYLAERFDQRTTEWKYIEAMLEMKTKAERAKNQELGGDSLSGIPGADVSGKTVEDALYYGLDALRTKKVIVKNVG